MNDLFLTLIRAGFPVFLGLVASAFLAYWLSKKLQGFIYCHTGRALLSFLYGLPSFIGLLFLFSLIGWSIGVGIMEGVTGKGSVEFFIMGGGFLTLLLTALILLVSCTLLIGNASSLKNNSIQKVSGVTLLLYTVPVFIPILLLLGAMLVFTSFA